LICYRHKQDTDDAVINNKSRRKLKELPTSISTQRKQGTADVSLNNKERLRLYLALAKYEDVLVDT
jgi:hypothetical protein